MTLPFDLPPWLPWWATILILVPVLLYGMVFVLMPFSVIGVKGRLETLDARLDEIQGEIRSLALRLPEPMRVGYEETPYVQPPARHRTAGADDPRAGRWCPGRRYRLHHRILALSLELTFRDVICAAAARMPRAVPSHGWDWPRR